MAIQVPVNTENKLIDQHGRMVDYVRLSVTDRCDFRCVYCMAEDMTFLPRKDVLSLEEIYQVARAFTQLGVKKLRITGGEPLVRKNILTLFEQLGKLSGLEELLLTTNGSQLEKMAIPLKNAGVNRINISIDSLDPVSFKNMTRTGDLEKVKRGIEASVEAGFDSIRLNTVILKGRNEHEIVPLLEYALGLGINIAYIEEMPLGAISDHERENSMCSNEDVKAILNSVYQLDDIPTQTAGPSRYSQVIGHKTKVGFISPVSHNFCETCNRVRVTVEGRLLLCLGNEYSVDLREVLRSSKSGEQDLKQRIIEAMDIKPLKHHFYDKDHTQIVRFMNMTGG